MGAAVTTDDLDKLRGETKEDLDKLRRETKDDLRSARKDGCDPSNTNTAKIEVLEEAKTQHDKRIHGVETKQSTTEQAVANILPQVKTVAKEAVKEATIERADFWEIPTPLGPFKIPHRYALPLAGLLLLALVIWLRTGTPDEQHEKLDKALQMIEKIHKETKTTVTTNGAVAKNP